MLKIRSKLLIGGRFPAQNYWYPNKINECLKSICQCSEIHQKKSSNREESVEVESTNTWRSYRTKQNHQARLWSGEVIKKRKICNQYRWMCSVRRRMKERELQTPGNPWQESVRATKTDENIYWRGEDDGQRRRRWQQQLKNMESIPRLVGSARICFFVGLWRLTGYKQVWVNFIFLSHYIKIFQLNTKLTNSLT